MRIDDNAEALAMMKRALGSLEAKIREAYNKGYQDGLNHMPDTFIADGIRYYRIKDEPQTDDLIKQANVLIGFEKEWLEMDEELETMSCFDCINRPIGAEICDEPCHYEPKTDCSWK